ncbi:hypothetical protein RvY_02410 [Ramazzottius varieornatus]|uniref:Uncharacterized protein n=1 Tax=Ramazzottius varieornatus TaxID=947166 RepID=A0A1D1UJN3_RAMVA|nr:hypothetical protein RvY_02410 [Ramazzottius varieornatus]
MLPLKSWELWFYVAAGGGGGIILILIIAVIVMAYKLATANEKLEKLQSGTVYTTYQPAVPVSQSWPAAPVVLQPESDDLAGVHFVENGTLVNNGAIPLQPITTTQQSPAVHQVRTVDNIVTQPNGDQVRRTQVTEYDRPAVVTASPPTVIPVGSRPVSTRRSDDHQNRQPHVSQYDQEMSQYQDPRHLSRRERSRRDKYDDMETSSQIIPRIRPEAVSPPHRAHRPRSNPDRDLDRIAERDFDDEPRVASRRPKGLDPRAWSYLDPRPLDHPVGRSPSAVNDQLLVRKTVTTTKTEAEVRDRDLDRDFPDRHARRPLSSDRDPFTQARAQDRTRSPFRERNDGFIY